MRSKFHWYNFAAKSKLEQAGEGILAELLEESRQESAPSPSPAEKAVGGAAKKCIKGKSCSATCIHINDECLVGLPPSVAVALSRVSKVLSEQVGEGRVSEEQAEEVVSKIKEGDKSQDKAFSVFKELVQSGKATEGEQDSVAKLLISTTLTPGQDRNAPRMMSFDEIEAALKPGKLEALEAAYQKSFTKDGKFDPSQKGGMGDLIKNNYLKQEVSDEVASAAYYMLPPKVRSAINRAGGVGGPGSGPVIYAGDDDKGNPKFSEKPTRERGIFLVKRWMEQGGLDPYTGKPIDIRNAEPEHMVAFAHALAKGGGGDQPRNLLWTASQPNNQKAGAGDDFKEWARKLKEYQSMGREKYERDVYNPAASKASAAKGKKGAAAGELAKALDATTTEERIKTVKGLIDSYGEKVRYLIRASGVGWQHQDRDLDHRKGGEPAFMNNGVPKLPGTKVKPSTAVLIALSAVEPSQRSSLIDNLERLRNARILTDEEVASVRGNNEARLKLQRLKSKEYGEGLAKLLNQFVPNLNQYLE